MHSHSSCTQLRWTLTAETRVPAHTETICLILWIKGIHTSTWQRKITNSWKLMFWHTHTHTHEHSYISKAKSNIHRHLKELHEEKIKRVILSVFSLFLLQINLLHEQVYTNCPTLMLPLFLLNKYLRWGVLFGFKQYFLAQRFLFIMFHIMICIRFFVMICIMFCIMSCTMFCAWGHLILYHIFWLGLDVWIFLVDLDVCHYTLLLDVNSNTHTHTHTHSHAPDVFPGLQQVSSSWQYSLCDPLALVTMSDRKWHCKTYNHWCKHHGNNVPMTTNTPVGCCGEHIVNKLSTLNNY